jgi:hypothetical protein
MFVNADLGTARSRELATSFPGTRPEDPSAAALPAAHAYPLYGAGQERKYKKTTWKLIVTTGTVFAIVVPVARATTAKNELHTTQTHSVLVGKRHEKATKNATDITFLPVGTGTPIEASTSDDYDNPQTIYGIPQTIYGIPQPTVSPAAADPSSDTPQNPPLIDGYLLIDQAS